MTNKRFLPCFKYKGKVGNAEILFFLWENEYAKKVSIHHIEYPFMREDVVAFKKRTGAMEFISRFEAMGGKVNGEITIAELVSQVIRKEKGQLLGDICMNEMTFIIGDGMPYVKDGVMGRHDKYTIKKPYIKT